MARLPYVDKDDLPPEESHLPLSTSNITRALSNAPRVANQSGLVARFIRDGLVLDPRLRELALIGVGYATGCAYEYAHHVRLGLECGVSEADIRAVAAESAGRASGLEPLAGAVLRAAREIAAGPGVSAATFAELGAGLDNREIVELVFATTNYLGVSRMLLSLGVDLEPEAEEYVRRFPLKAPPAAP
jgi:AhpD family alkylhydroperoxidase